jgi:DNA-binding transcriptional ArsR family regulator
MMLETVAATGSPAQPAAQDHFAELRRSARRATCVLKAMANEHRLLILCQLVGRECSVNELVRIVGLSQSALSQHLAKLRRDQLVRTRRQAQTIYYSLASREIEAIIATLYDLYCRGDGAAEAGLEPAATPLES